ncbi:hypothetical protein [Thiomicrorhabdus sp.]|uniref:hypothetical protein n=1 Tax=Thiomicrorhabdus sp. TaxID=2039724 RepID=UPI0029C76BB3|nr:hypothetical protein [Thiomicrorhabdus sp.]
MLSKTTRILLASIFALFTSFAVQADGAIPQAKNLQTLGQKALQKNIPIAILFASQGLKSTQNLKDLALDPIVMSGELDDKVIFTELHPNDGDSTIDFYGEKTANSEFKQIYNLTSLPVVIFVNGEGDQIAPPLLSGAYDFYYHYFKQHLEQAQKQLDSQ